jgi:sirohydrochlorin cobaltochelatase
LSANDALLLIGHGSVRYPDAGGVLQRHVQALRAGGWFAQVEAAVLNGQPTVAEALVRIEAPVVRVVPFFMEDGYFSQVAVPRAIVMVDAPVRRSVLCPPVGVHDGMAGIIEHQALAACAGLGVSSRAAAVVVIGHGSASAPGRALALHRHASRAAGTELFGRVEAACLEEAPFVADVLRGLRAHPVVVIGFFANRGGHVLDDVPGLIAAEQQARGVDGLAVRFYGSVTDDPAMVTVILEQSRSVP